MLVNKSDEGMSAFAHLVDRHFEDVALVRASSFYLDRSMYVFLEIPKYRSSFRLEDMYWQ